MTIICEHESDTNICVRKGENTVLQRRKFYLSSRLHQVGGGRSRHDTDLNINIEIK